MWIENFKITLSITLQSNNDDGSNFYFTDILPLGKQNQPINKKSNIPIKNKPPDNQKNTNKQQNTMKAHSDAHSVFEPGFGHHGRLD